MTLIKNFKIIFENYDTTLYIAIKYFVINMPYT